jgi:hypothetical protein
MIQHRYILKKSDVPGKIPQVSDLVAGEVAINTADGKIFLKKDNGSIVDVVASALGGAGFDYNSPNFLGNPTVPTQVTADSSTRIASTQFTHNAIAAALLGGGGGGLTPADTAYVQGLIDSSVAPYALTSSLSAYALTTSLAPYALTTSLSAYAPINSPALTGIPTAPTATVGDSTAQIATTAFVTSTTSSVVTTVNLLVPIGSVIYHTKAAAPDGYLIANGSAINRTAYANLFAVIGTTFGAGNGTTTFNIPDLRGVFLRGLDLSKGYDSGRTLGSYQADEFKSHNHGNKYVANATYSYSGGGANNTPAGSIRLPFDGGTETRPKNIALLPCIKY